MAFMRPQTPLTHVAVTHAEPPGHCVASLQPPLELDDDALDDDELLDEALVDELLDDELLDEDMPLDEEETSPLDDDAPLDEGPLEPLDEGPLEPLDELCDMPPLPPPPLPVVEAEP